MEPSSWSLIDWTHWYCGCQQPTWNTTWQYQNRKAKLDIFDFAKICARCVGRCWCCSWWASSARIRSYSTAWCSNRRGPSISPSSYWTAPSVAWTVGPHKIQVNFTITWFYLVLFYLYLYLLGLLGYVWFPIALVILGFLFYPLLFHLYWFDLLFT